MRAFLLALSLGMVTSSAACGNTDASAQNPDHPPGGPGDGTPPQSALPCEVTSVFKRSCWQCHGATPMYGAPMPLVTYEDLHAASRLNPSKTVFARVQERVHDDSNPMPPPPYPRLGAADLAVLDQWSGSGAPAGTGSACSTDPGSPPQVVEPLNCAADLQIRPASAWTMPDGQADAYVCYGMDITSPMKRHLVGFGPKIDNAKILHHLVLFQSDVAVSSTPFSCEAALGSAWRPVAIWAPGVGNFYPPQEAGFVQQGTTHWVMQIHYHNFKNLTGQTDASGYDICSTDKLRPNDADVLFLGGVNFVIPPHTKTTYTCKWSVPVTMAPFQIFAALPHMHQLGSFIESDQTPQLGGGMTSQIVSVLNYIYEYQRIYPINTTIAGSDMVKTTCVWRNTRPDVVTFGMSTSTDEMCYDIIYYYPQITTPGWTFFSPINGSTCQDTFESL